MLRVQRSLLYVAVCCRFKTSPPDSDDSFQFITWQAEKFELYLQMLVCGNAVVEECCLSVCVPAVMRAYDRSILNIIYYSVQEEQRCSITTKLSLLPVT